MKRSKTHIFRIMTLIFKIWVKNPSLRFCQLIGNCFGADQANYFEEDKELEKNLKERYGIE